MLAKPVLTTASQTCKGCQNLGVLLPLLDIYAKYLVLFLVMKFLIFSLPEMISKSLNEEKSASSILFLVSYELEGEKKKLVENIT